MRHATPVRIILVDDHEMLRIGMVIYEALYTWCRAHAGERHDWYPEQIPTGAPR